MKLKLKLIHEYITLSLDCVKIKKFVYIYLFFSIINVLLKGI